MNVDKELGNADWPKRQSVNKVLPPTSYDENWIDEDESEEA